MYLGIEAGARRDLWLQRHSVISEGGVIESEAVGLFVLHQRTTSDDPDATSVGGKGGDDDNLHHCLTPRDEGGLFVIISSVLPRAVVTCSEAIGYAGRRRRR